MTIYPKGFPFRDDLRIRNSPLAYRSILAGSFSLRNCLLLITYCLLLFFNYSCNSKPTPTQEIDPRLFKESLSKVNKYMIEKESDEIAQYMKRHNWQMEITGTGLHYMFIKRGTGKQPTTGQMVKMNYKILLLDGTVCYSSENNGPKEFVIDNDNVESGIHEAAQLMHVGDKAKFILPSHLAHGFHGDDEKIPPLASVVVDLELLEIK